MPLVVASRLTRWAWLTCCLTVAVLGCGLPAAGESIAPGYGGFRVTVQNELDEWIIAYSDHQFADLPVNAKQARVMEWFGTKDPLDEGGNEKNARVEAYRVLGTPPLTEADQDVQRGELLFCRDFTFRELASIGWVLEIVPGDIRCEPRRFFTLPDAQ
jgi:hypothetical protein